MSMGIKGTYVGVASQIAVQPFSINSIKISGKYYSAALFAAPFSGGLVGDSNLIAAEPFLLSKRTIFDRIGIDVQVAETGGHVRLGIYSDDGFYYPKDRLVFTSELDTSSVAFVEENISITLEAGLYWLVSNYDSALTLQISEAPDCTLSIGGEPGTSLVGSTYYKTSFTYAPLPNPFPAGCLISSGAASIFLRVA
jgi:hypothetical protein